MNALDVDNDGARTLRQAQLTEQSLRQAQAEEEARKNKGFTQVYSKGWQRIRDLLREFPAGAAMYAFLAEHIDPSCGAVVCSQQLLAEELGISERYVRTVSKRLEEMGALVRVKISAGTYAYALDPSEVWKSFDSAKPYAVFKTKTLARKADNGSVRRRVQVMLHGADPRQLNFEDALNKN